MMEAAATLGQDVGKKPGLVEKLERPARRCFGQDAKDLVSDALPGDVFDSRREVADRSKRLGFDLIAQAGGNRLVGWLSALVPALFSVGAFVLMYRTMPRAPVRWRDVWLGGLIAGLVWGGSRWRRRRCTVFGKGTRRRGGTMR